MANIKLEIKKLNFNMYIINLLMFATKTLLNKRPHGPSKTLSSKVLIAVMYPGLSMNGSDFAKAVLTRRPDLIYPLELCVHDIV